MNPLAYDALLGQQRVQIGLVPIDVVTMRDAVRRVSQYLISGDPGQFVISGVNAHFINTAHKDARFARFLSGNHLNVADGVSLLLASRILGAPLPERVTGIDLMIELCGMAAKNGYSIYLLGGRPGAAQGAADHLLQLYPGLQIVGIDRPPIGREHDPVVAQQIRARICDARPDFLFVCFGVPRQEDWIQTYAPDLPVRVVMGNGAAFDVLAGIFRRPPRWVQNVGMEWLYRFCAEPFRLWKRYLIGNLEFVGTIIQQQRMRKREL